MIKISNLQKRFDDLEVLRDVNIDVAEGEVVCIIGPSGSGKSTFLRVHCSAVSISWKLRLQEKLNMMEKVSPVVK